MNKYSVLKLEGLDNNKLVTFYLWTRANKNPFSKYDGNTAQNTLNISLVNVNKQKDFENVMFLIRKFCLGSFNLVEFACTSFSTILVLVKYLLV